MSLCHSELICCYKCYQHQQQQNHQVIYGQLIQPSSCQFQEMLAYNNSDNNNNNNKPKSARGFRGGNMLVCYYTTIFRYDNNLESSFIRQILTLLGCSSATRFTLSDGDLTGKQWIAARFTERVSTSVDNFYRHTWLTASTYDTVTVPT